MRFNKKKGGHRIYIRRKKNGYLKKYEGERFKVRLDAKTVIIIRDMGSLKVWLAKYPHAKVIAKMKAA